MNTTTEDSVNNNRNAQISRFSSMTIADAGKVRLGGQGPVFRPALIADAGKVRLDGQGPIFR